MEKERGWRGELEEQLDKMEASAAAGGEGQQQAAQAVQRENEALRQSLAEAHALHGRDGMAPLHLAAARNHAPLVQALLEAGAPVNLQMRLRGQLYTGEWVSRATDGSTEELTPYEQMRAANIARNEQALIALGLGPTLRADERRRAGSTARARKLVRVSS